MTTIIPQTRDNCELYKTRYSSFCQCIRHSEIVIRRRDI